MGCIFFCENAQCYSILVCEERVFGRQICCKLFRQTGDRFWPRLYMRINNGISWWTSLNILCNAVKRLFQISTFGLSLKGISNDKQVTPRCSECFPLLRSFLQELHDKRKRKQSHVLFVALVSKFCWPLGKFQSWTWTFQKEYLYNWKSINSCWELCRKKPLVSAVTLRVIVPDTKHNACAMPF